MNLPSHFFCFKKVGLAFIDAFSDVAFVIERFTVGDEAVAWFLLVSIVLPMTVNLVLIAKMMDTEFRHQPVKLLFIILLFYI